MLIKKIFLYIILALLSFNIYSQTREELEKQKKRKQQEIAYTNKLINETRKSKKTTLNHLKLINKKINIRQEIITDIKYEINLINEKIDENNIIINSLQDDLKRLKQEYAKMIYYAYKNSNSYSRLMYVFSSKDFNQAYKRIKYLQQYSKFRKRQVEAIKATQKVLELKLGDLKNKMEEKQKLISSEKKETNNLNSEKQEQGKLIGKLKDKEIMLKKRLAKHRKAAIKLEKAIKDLIAKEIAKSKASNKEKEYKLTPEEKLISKNFGENKGRLPWPIIRGVITSSFGKHEHEQLKGVEVNNDGIIISTQKNSTARAVFDGVVRQVITIPGKHVVIIIRHGNYFSVYSNLKEAYVAQGQKVSSKEEIGLIYTDGNDNTTNLELQIWKGTSKMNPQYWLSKK